MSPGHPERDVNRWAVSTFVERCARSLSPGVLILDAGAGEGRYRALFHRQRYVSADLAVGDVDWDYGGLDVLTDLGRLPFPDGSFDHVLSTQTLEHLAEPWRFLEEAARLLRSGGTLFLTAPFAFRAHQEPHDYYRYTRHGLRHLFTRAGLEVVSIEPQGGYFWFLADAIRPLHRRLFGKERALLWRICTAPLVLVSKFLFTAFLPFVFYRLDFLDKKRILTTGHEAVARKPGGGER